MTPADFRGLDDQALLDLVAQLERACADLGYARTETGLRIAGIYRDRLVDARAELDRRRT